MKSCVFRISSVMPDKAERTIVFEMYYSENPEQESLIKFRKRIRKPHLWHGVEYKIFTSQGQTIFGVFEG